MIKVLHISRTMGQGGAEKVVYQLCKDISIVIPIVASCGGSYVEELEKCNIRHIVIPDIDRKKMTLVIKTFRTLLKIIKDNRIEAIHTHHRMAAFYGRLLQIVNPSLKHIYTSHNVFYGKRRLLRFALSKAKIVACGNIVKKNLVGEYGIPDSIIKVIHNSIEPGTIKPVKTVIDKFDNNMILIGCIGRISKQKGFDIFIKSVSKAVKQNPNIVGVLIGDGDKRNEIEQLVDNLGIRKNIVFLGFQKDVISLINKLDFAVLPSRWEGFPLTLIEVFSVKKTIICSDIDNNLEIVHDGKNGLVFHKEDYNDLASKICKLIEDSDLKNQLEEQAYQDYQTDFGYSVFLRKYADVYASIVEHD